MSLTKREKEQLFNTLEAIVKGQSEKEVNLSLFNGDKIEIFQRLTKVEGTTERIEQVMNTKLDYVIGALDGLPCEQHQTLLNKYMTNEKVNTAVTKTKFGLLWKIIVGVGSVSGLGILIVAIISYVTTGAPN